MTNEEIIAHLDELERFDVEHEDNRQALREAIAKLRALDEDALSKNEPLTETQLKGMDGEAVFCIPKGKATGYMGIVTAAEASIICRGGFVPFYLYRAIYRTHPDNQLNEPLTLEVLRGMNAKPGWLDCKYEKGWGIISVSESGGMISITTVNDTYFIYIHGEYNDMLGAKLYRHQPEEEEDQ